MLSSAINSERAPLGIEVMRHGKDYMSDKPGITSLAQLAEVRKVQAETRRIYSICYSEHFQVRATVKAGELVRAGAIGRMVNTVGLGPHRLTNAPRPPWFFQREKYGGVLTDIGSHQCEQFLFFADVNSAEVVSATVKNTSNPQTPELQDFGEMLVRSQGRHRLHPGRLVHAERLPVWGDGRLIILGDQGYIELRKYIDLDGAPGADHAVPGEPKGRTAHRLQQCRAAVFTPADRRHPQPHRDRDAAGALLRRRRACAYRAGAGGAALRRASQSCARGARFRELKEQECGMAVHAETILRNGTVWCGRAEGVAQAVALWGGRVLATGSDADIAALIGPAHAGHRSARPARDARPDRRAPAPVALRPRHAGGRRAPEERADARRPARPDQGARRGARPGQMGAGARL